ncbi:hypothetical protein KAK06_05505 [Ideonella sp. 4Y11]|uniref:YCII-related domain-containing protein n=1 Tax=Ideonella aquatica TaxID=2824119 RepID=A0A941BJ18_9BURK|nr:hypothetical protein [Ideonella aquatica]MBQ0958408.1 hypothetical protein [Ideonella aquatica]
MSTRRTSLRAAAGLLSAAALSPAEAQTSPPARDQRWVVVHRPGPAWQSGVSPFEQPGLDTHIAHYRRWQQEGKLALGGPFMDGSAGGMMIAAAGVPEAEVRAHAQSDPAVQSGLLTAELRPWLIGMRGTV